MTVGELKELLDDYGDHLLVVIVNEVGPMPYSVGSGQINGEISVILDVAND